MTLAACTNGTATTHTSATHEVAHTSSDTAACRALVDLLNAGEQSTSAQAHAVISAGQAANNLQLLKESEAMNTDATKNDPNGIRSQVRAMAETCNSMGIGPSS